MLTKWPFPLASRKAISTAAGSRGKTRPPRRSSRPSSTPATAPGSTLDISDLRLTDRVGARVRVLFVGINPGVRSAVTDHHFAGPSNRFWKLLFDAGLVPEALTYSDDHRLPEWGLGVTNLVPRPTPGIDTLRPDEYAAGLIQLRQKVRRWKPEIVALVGVTLYRFVFGVRPGVPVSLGAQPETFEGAPVFVLPNPSGRNANFSYAQMLAAFATLKTASGIGCHGI